MSTESNKNAIFGSENKFHELGIWVIGFQTIKTRLYYQFLSARQSCVCSDNLGPFICYASSQLPLYEMNAWKLVYDVAI